jgi:hypothetical protein
LIFSSLHRLIHCQPYSHAKHLIASEHFISCSSQLPGAFAMPTLITSSIFRHYATVAAAISGFITPKAAIDFHIYAFRLTFRYTLSPTLAPLIFSPLIFFTPLFDRAELHILLPVFYFLH